MAKCVFSLALAIIAGWPAHKAHASSISRRARTEIEWFDNAEEKTAAAAFQYLPLMPSPWQRRLWLPLQLENRDKLRLGFKYLYYYRPVVSGDRVKNRLKRLEE